MTFDLHHPHVEYMTINLPVSVGPSKGGLRRAAAKRMGQLMNVS